MHKKRLRIDWCFTVYMLQTDGYSRGLVLLCCVMLQTWCAIIATSSRLGSILIYHRDTITANCIPLNELCNVVRQLLTQDAIMHMAHCLLSNKPQKCQYIAV